MYSQSLIVIDLQLPEKKHKEKYKISFLKRNTNPKGKMKKKTKQKTQMNKQKHQKDLLMLTTRQEHNDFFPNHLQLPLKSTPDTLLLPYRKLTPCLFWSEPSPS